MADLPRGAVTFLFTDIEGSTRLVKQLRERYRDVLGVHQRLLREAFAAHEGHEIDTQGDSFFVAFASARDAVLAAVEAQLALSHNAWPEGVSVGVRMGIHTGQASPSDGRYTGIAVHRAARIGAAAHGGQVLVSQATQTLLEDEEEDLAVGLRDLGPQRLKDLDRPVHLFQVDAPGLATEFPPLRAENHAHAAPVAPPRPVLRRRGVWLVAAGIALVLGAALGAVLFTRGGGTRGLSLVHPNSVGVIDPASNEVVAEVPVGIRPGPVAAGGGSVWVGNLDDRTLTRVDVRTRANTRTVSLDNQTPTGVAVGDGAVWVAHGFLGRLTRVDPQFGQVTKTVDVVSPSDDGEVAVGDGSVWAVYAESTLARVDPSSLRVLDQAIAGAEPSGVVFAAGSVWVVNGGDQTVSRFIPATFTEGRLKTISVGDRPSAITFGGGAVWVANGGDGTVTRIDVRSYATFTLQVGPRPGAIAFGAGAVWVANGDGTVSRIDPSSRRVVKTIHVGNAPAGIAVGDGNVWVAVQAP
jgi:YVTN family beta-propeller protein